MSSNKLAGRGITLYIAFALVRVANVALIQSQFDPDEYWQNLEPAYCYVYGHGEQDSLSCQGLTWEWRRRPKTSTALSIFNDVSSVVEAVRQAMEQGPVRSFASIVPTMIFYHIIQRLQWDSSWMISRGPLVLNAILVAATTDWTVWYVSQQWIMMLTTPTITSTTTKTKMGISTNSKPLGSSSNSWINFCVYCSLTSWFNAYALVRTYSNSLETMLVAVSVSLVSQDLLLESRPMGWERVANACIAFFLGGVCSAIRFTCLTIYVPLGVILSLKLHTKTATVSYLMGICAIFGASGFLSTVLLDRIMYGFWAFPVLGNIHFNVLQGYGSLYGTHPFYWYLVSGIPALTGMLLPVLCYDLILANSWDYGRRNLWIIIGSCVIAHSGSAHKEFRFLLPVLPLFCLVAGTRLQDVASKWRRQWFLVSLLTVGAALNFVAVAYLGLIHQRGSIDVNRMILNEVVAPVQTSRLVSTSPDHQRIHIHYLMGCHSTPLMSHLHAPPIQFETWYLDCGPTCRADPNVDCESESFSKNPTAFLQQAYYRCSGEKDDRTCAAASANSLEGSTAVRAVPDFVVCDTDNLKEIRNFLESPIMNMEEIGRFFQGIHSIQVGSPVFEGAEDDLNSKKEWSEMQLFYGFVRLRMEEIVLFRRVMN
ncbi:Alg9-like mannosyltransferase family-domain containing protein [Nitzschia inconspicua]|uniref:Mannosyltransferase n=1 Tax=Nitzschia inconspicua TaxID=303405 RepID=A0A9K3LLN7_9STRA|nr:Alg9-like mannosyltransferase family-domain containing protein [Nitzschia inconspicua]